jgi:SpoIID/LytB domain protein
MVFRVRALLRTASCALIVAISVVARAQPVPTLRVGLAWHRSSVVFGGPGGFVVSAGGQEWQAQGRTCTAYLPAAAPDEATGRPRPPGADVYLSGLEGAGRWCSFPVRARPAQGCVEGLWAGEDPKSLRRYAGELELTRDASGMLALVNVVDLEAYARGVINAEMEPNYPPEALKAQAVAIRSVALATLGRHRADGFDCCAEAHCQAYRGISGQTPVGNAAVDATRGQVLTYGGRLANAVYHAACGGHTENSSDVWGGPEVPYLRGVPDNARAGNPGADGYRAEDQRLREYLTGAPPANCRQPDYLNPTRFRWVRALTREQIEKSLADIVGIGELIDLRPLQRGASGRIVRLEVRGTQGASTLSPESVIRRALGGLPSSAFVVDRYCDDRGRPVVFVLWGAGWGHGVGMCQAGAAGMAQAGRTYREILAKYYLGTEIETRY